MSTRTRRGDAALADVRRTVARVTTELREARLAADLSLESAARAAGLSSSQLSRLELGRLERPDLEQVWRAASVVGLRPSLVLYPAGSPVRDRAQLALLARFERCLGEPLRMRREVPLPLQGDLRAWDALVEGPDGGFFTEGESHVRDAQALERRIRLKVRDDPRARVVVLVLTRTDHHRAVLAEHRETMRDLFPLDGAAVLRAVRAGRCPPASGIVLV
jgi:transcriptional regulator with XRE-family HTH domain